MGSDKIHFEVKNVSSIDRGRQIKVGIIPKTIAGRWSVGLAIVFWGFYGLLLLAVASGQEGGPTFFSNPTHYIPLLGMFFSGTAAFFTGIGSVIFKKERAILVYPAIAWGFFVLWFGMAELFSTH